MGDSVRRVVVDLIADDRGAFAPVRLSAIRGVLLALVTTPGDPALSDRFDVRLELHDCTPDVLCGCGRGRHGRLEERRVVRVVEIADLHPTVRDGDLTLHVSGNRQPHARLTVALIYADLN